MSGKINVEIEPNANSAVVKGQFGDWIIYIPRESAREEHCFTSTVGLKAAQRIPEMFQADLKIKYRLVGESGTFELEAERESGLRYEVKSHTDFQGFRITVEIDATAIANLTPDEKLSKFTKDMLASGKLADITIKTTDGNGKGEIKASRFFLSRSPVFDAMLNDHDSMEAQQGVILIEDIKHEVMVEMIRYMYTDEIPKMKEMAFDLLLAADKYKLRGLISRCEAYLIDEITAENFAKILILGDKLNLQAIKYAFVKVVNDNFNKIIETADWKELIEKENPHIAIEIFKRIIKITKK